VLVLVVVTSSSAVVVSGSLLSVRYVLSSSYFLSGQAEGIGRKKLISLFLGLPLDFFRPNNRPNTEFFLSIFLGSGLSLSCSTSVSSCLLLSFSSWNARASLLDNLNDPPLAVIFCDFFDILND